MKVGSVRGNVCVCVGVRGAIGGYKQICTFLRAWITGVERVFELVFGRLSGGSE